MLYPLCRILSFALCLIALGATVALNPLDAHAQTYPAKPIRLIMPAPAGAPPDVVGRLFARQLSEVLGQQVLVENRPGAGWTLGLTELTKAAPDGYTLGWIVTGVFALGPTLFPNTAYEVRSDFTPVGLASRSRMFLVVHPSIPVKSLPEFIDYARARPGKLNYSSAGVGTLPHLVMEMFKANTGLDLVHVPFKGNHFTTLVAGDVQAVFDSAVAFAPFMRSGKARVLAVASDTRDRDFPDIISAKEAGNAIDGDVLQGLLAPRGTSATVIAALNTGMRKVAAEPKYQEALAKLSTEAMSTSPEEFSRSLASEIDKWTKVWKSSGAKME